MWLPTDEVGVVRCDSCDEQFRPSVNPCECPVDHIGEDAVAADDHDLLLAGAGAVDDLDRIQHALIALCEETRESRRKAERAKKEGLARARASAALADVERKLLVARADIELERAKIRALLKSESTVERIRAIRERRAH